MIYEVNDNDINKRLDIFLKEKSGLSRTYVSTLLDENMVLVNDIVVNKPSYKIKNNDVVLMNEKEVETLDLVPKDIPLDIIYEDSDILVINKQKGLVVHPSCGHFDDTLVNAILYHCNDNLSTINGVLRPGIVHRIDKDTSGILLICKNDNSHIFISKQFVEHTHVRKYFAIVKGVINQKEFTIDKPIGRDKRNRKKMAIDENGKNAITVVKVIKKFNNYTFVECELKTGRTHQIRVHMSSLGHPILGDLIYGKKDRNFQDVETQVLHAYYMSFIHPSLQKNVEYTTDIPLYMKNILETIEKNNW